MAKIFKATIYFVDYLGENESFESIQSQLEYRCDFVITPYDIQESKEFEWADNLKINRTDATRDDHEEYFK